MSLFEDKDWVRVEVDDPARCHAVTGKGQCFNKQVADSKFCPAHGANKAMEKAKKIRVKQYLLSKWNARAADLCDGENIKNLRGEVGILRMLLESKLNACSSEVELAVQSPALADLVLKVSKLVTNCHRLEAALGKVMDESQLMSIADAIIKIISEYVEDEETLQLIAKQIGFEIAEIATRSSS